MAKKKTEEQNEEIIETQEEIKAQEVNKEPLCPTCRYYIKNVCEHFSNIQILIKKRIEKKVYKSTEQKTECPYYDNVQPKA